MVNVALPENWSAHRTSAETQLSNHWAMWGISCISKVGKKWDSAVPGAPLFKTKTAAYEYLSRFVCDAIPLRCVERVEAMRALPVRRVSIECVDHPEWGSWGVMEDRGDYYEISNGRGSRVLSKDEAGRFWRVRQ